MKKNLCLFISIFFLGMNLVYANDTVKFSKCVDGDTLRVKNKQEDIIVRLLAIDTPELAKNGKQSEYYANEASEFTCNKIKNAKKIELEYDINSDKTDKYDRVLAWVFVDGELLQEDLVKNGYAKVAYLYADYKYTSILQEKQELASVKKIGIWNSEEKNKYQNNEIDNMDEVSNKIVFLIGLIILVIVFICDKILKRKK